jgi:DnaJ-class molecular chaperone
MCGEGKSCDECRRGPCGSDISWTYEDEKAMIAKCKEEGKCQNCYGRGQVFSHHKPGGAGWAWKICHKCLGTGLNKSEQKEG